VNILITGGAGFIGNHLSRALLEKGHSITVVDLPEKISACKIQGAKLKAIDICHYSEMEKEFQGETLDIIYHLAAQTSGRISQEDPELDVNTNAKGTLNVVRLARKMKITKLIFSSSMASYGDYSGEIPEETLQKPISNYGITKVCGELFVRTLELYGIKHTILRLFNVYGPGQDLQNMKQGMVSIFMAQSLLQNEIVTTGSLERYRDLVYVTDVVSALLLALEPSTDGEILNVGTGEKTTVRELIEAIISVNDQSKSLTYVQGESHEGDQFGLFAKNEKIRALGWCPTVNLQDGLKAMYLDAKERLIP
jgi:UDP-glucose 4-epimerase